MHLLDAALNLPEEKHSHGLRKLTAIEAARGSMEAAGAAITRATGVTIGKRQLEELARRCAAHVEAFYLARGQPGPGWLALILTFDGKGIVMLPAALRRRPRRPPRPRRASSPPGCRPGRRTAASGWPSWPASTTPPPSRAPPKTSSAPPRRRERGRRRPGRQGKGKPREPQARGK